MESVYNQPVAMIVDIVGSRKIKDREAAQAQIADAFVLALDHAKAISVPEETVGDEFQGVFETRAQALTFTGVVRLALDDDVDVRFGLGSGDRQRVTRSGIEDGPAWWSAREAVAESRRRQHGRFPACRTWYSAGVTAVEDPAPRRAAALQEEAIVNAYLLGRDAVISRLGSRERRRALGLLDGKTQEELAREDGVSQPAVSKSLARSGVASLVEGLKLLKAATL
jgi:hypothetical protein